MLTAGLAWNFDLSEMQDVRFLWPVAVSLIAACASVEVRSSRTIVCASDSIHRSRDSWDRQDSSSIAVILGKPSRPHRVVGTVVGYQDANWDEEVLWRNLRVRGRELGADGLVLLDRRIVACSAPAQGQATSVASGERSVSETVAIGPRNFECVQLLVDVVVWEGAYDCKTENNCRYDRSNAYAVSGPSLTKSARKAPHPKLALCMPDVRLASSATTSVDITGAQDAE